MNNRMQTRTITFNGSVFWMLTGHVTGVPDRRWRSRWGGLWLCDGGPREHVESHRQHEAYRSVRGRPPATGELSLSAPSLTCRGYRWVCRRRCRFQLNGLLVNRMSLHNSRVHTHTHKYSTLVVLLSVLMFMTHDVACENVLFHTGSLPGNYGEVAVC